MPSVNAPWVIQQLANTKNQNVLAMEHGERKHRLWQGLSAACVPAVLFFPAVALLTICPPNYGLWGMRAIGAVFLFSEIFSGWIFVGVIQRKLDWINGLAFLGLLVAAVVLAATAWGFIAPFKTL